MGYHIVHNVRATLLRCELSLRAIIVSALALVATVLVSPISSASSAPRPPATVSEVLSDIAFFNPHLGYGYFVRQGPVQCQAEVGLTDDGGAVFGPLAKVTSWDCADNPTVHFLAFDDHGDGFLYGPGLYVSHDGGRTWAAGHIPGSVLSVQALGESIWAATARCANPATLACRLALFESSNGGRSWAPAHVPVTGANPYLGEAGQSWLDRTSGSTAYLLSSPAGKPGSNDDHALLWLTTDGGASWSERSVPCHIGAMSASLSVAVDGTLFVVCGGGPSAGFQPKSVVRSTDGGVRWTVEMSCDIGSPRHIGPRPGPGCSSYINGGYLGGIDALSSGTVFLYGGRSSLLVSRDGGAEWGPVRPLIGDTSGGSGPVIFFNQSDGVVMANNPRNNEELTIWSTSDGGVRWTAVVPHSETAVVGALGAAPG